MSAWPVIYRASSEARKTAAFPMSSGVCSHFMGTISFTRFSNTCRAVIPSMQAGGFGLRWNAAMETGGVIVGDKVKLSIDAEFIKPAG